MTPIQTVSGPGLTLSQGPVVAVSDDATTVRIGPNTVAVGKPVPAIRRNQQDTANVVE